MAITAEEFVGAQCRAVVGPGNAKDADWPSGQQMTGVWYGDQPDAAAHQAAMQCAPDGLHDALAVSPL